MHETKAGATRAEELSGEGTESLYHFYGVRRQCGEVETKVRNGEKALADMNPESGAAHMCGMLHR